MDEVLLDLRDLAGRRRRLTIAFVLGMAAAAGGIVFASILPVGPSDRPVAREWFMFATAGFAALVAFGLSLARMNGHARKRWQAARRHEARATGRGSTARG